MPRNLLSRRGGGKAHSTSYQNNRNVYGGGEGREGGRGCSSND